MHSKRKYLISCPRFYQTCLVGISSIATLTALALVNPPKSYVLADAEQPLTSKSITTAKSETPIPQVTRTIQAVDPEGNVLHEAVQRAEADPLRQGQSIWPDYFIPRIEGYHPSNNQAQQVMPETVNNESHDEVVKVHYKKGDGQTKPGALSSISFAWVWYDGDGQSHTVYYPNKLMETGINVSAPSAPKNAKIVSPMPKSFYIYPGGVTYRLRIQPLGIEPQTQTITRTINLELPDGTHQIKKQSLSFHKDLIFNEEPAGFALTPWLPTSSNIFDEYELPKIEGYTCGQSFVPKLELTQQLLEKAGDQPALNVSLIYKPVEQEKPADSKPSDQGKNDTDKKVPTQPSTSDGSTQTDDSKDSGSVKKDDDSQPKDDASQTDDSKLPVSKDDQTQTDHHEVDDKGTQTDHSGTIDTGTQTENSKKETDKVPETKPVQPENDHKNTPATNDHHHPDVPTVKPHHEADQHQDQHQPGSKTDSHQSSQSSKPIISVDQSHQASSHADRTEQKEGSDKQQKAGKQSPILPNQSVSPESSASGEKENADAFASSSDDGQATDPIKKSDSHSSQGNPREDQPVAAAGVVTSNHDLPQTGNSSNLPTFISVLVTVLLGWLGLHSFKENDHQPK